jgi:hypothetical protein
MRARPSASRLRMRRTSPSPRSARSNMEARLARYSRRIGPDRRLGLIFFIGLPSLAKTASATQPDQKVLHVERFLTPQAIASGNGQKHYRNPGDALEAKQAWRRVDIVLARQFELGARAP